MQIRGELPFAWHGISGRVRRQSTGVAIRFDLDDRHVDVRFDIIAARGAAVECLALGDGGVTIAAERLRSGRLGLGATW